MSTVLWANYLVDGQVVSEEADYPALYHHVDKLDEICHKLEIIPISDMVDSTDREFNALDMELPEGMESTTDIMAAEGRWIAADEAVEAMDELKAYLIEHYPHIGLLHNATPDIITELEESIDWAITAESLSAKFNFSIVM